MAEKTKAVLEAELKTSERKTKELQKDVDRKDKEKRDLQTRLDNSLDKNTAEFFMGKIIVIVEKILEDC